MATQEEIQALVQFSFFRVYLAELLVACSESHIDLLVLKGPALAETVYPRPSLRLFGDLDVLVRASEISPARALLESLGYTPEPRQWEDLVQGRYCQTNFFKHPERGAVVVELHTELINNPFFFGVVRLDAGVWERAEAACLAGEAARVLGPEDQVLHLCLHLACHYGAAPRSLRDIDQVCRARALDWPLLVDITRRSRASAACFAGLFACADLLGTPVPASALDALAPRFGRGLLERLTIARAADIGQERTEWLRFPLLWLLLETSGARWNALRHVFVPSPRWLSAHYYLDVFGETEPPSLSRRAYFALLRAHWSSLLRWIIRH